jgi:hypothetical protein
MAVVSLANTSANLSGKTAVLAEADQTITGLQSFNRGTGSPFAVNTGAAKVDNLDADKLDGLDGAQYAKLPVWVGFTPVIGAAGGGTAALNTNNGTTYLVQGKLLIIQFYISLTITGNVNNVTLQLPAGYVSSALGYSATPFYLAVVGAGLAQTTPGSTVINLYRDSATAYWPIGGSVVAGTLSIPLA